MGGCQIIEMPVSTVGDCDYSRKKSLSKYVGSATMTLPSSPVAAPATPVMLV